jgi:hypothetical protein
MVELVDGEGGRARVPTTAIHSRSVGSPPGSLQTAAGLSV